MREFKGVKNNCLFRAKTDKHGIVHILDLSSSKPFMSVTNGVDKLAPFLLSKLEGVRVKDNVILYGTDDTVSMFHVPSKQFLLLHPHHEFIDYDYYDDMVAIKRGSGLVSGYGRVFYFNTKKYDIIDDEMGKKWRESVLRHSRLHNELSKMGDDPLPDGNLKKWLDQGFCFWVKTVNTEPYFNKGMYLVELYIRYVSKPVLVYVWCDELDGLVLKCDRYE
jgi:hypothetical protein